MSALPVATLSRAEYLRRERRAESRSEYHCGHVVAMAGASRNHNEIVMNISASLRAQLRGRQCSNYASEMRVSVQGGERYVFPDVVVTCGPQVFEDGERDSLINPILILEVLSPSTEAYDRGDKFLYDQGIDSLREYVLVSQVQRRIELFRKQPDGTWHYLSWPPAELPVTLLGIQCILNADEVYDKVEGLAS